MSYKRPILREIYAEVHLQEGALPQIAFVRLAQILTEAGLTLPEFNQVQSFKMDAAGGPPTIHVAPRIRLWNPEKNQLAQFSPDEFYFNLVGPYLGWQAFDALRETTEKAVRTATGKEPALRQVSLILLDSMKVPAAGYTLGKYLKCGGAYIPSWYATSTEAIDISMGRGVLPNDRLNRAFKIAVRPADDGVSIEINSTFRAAALSGRSLKELIHSLHDDSTAVFEEMITDTTRNDIMGGVK